jgi:hypothetical protein
MPANVSGGEIPFPVRGVAGGWRDPWDEPDDSARLRARAEASERRQLRRAEVLGVAWRAQIAAEKAAPAPHRANRPA